MFNWLRPKPAQDKGRDASTFFGIPSRTVIDNPGERALDTLQALIDSAPRVAASDAAMDGYDGYDGDGGASMLKQRIQPTALSEALALWYSSQGFIGHQFCAILAQHWLIDKACSMPGRDAIRNGYDIVSSEGSDELAPEAVAMLRRYDRQMRLNWNLEQFIRMGRVFGVRIAFFRVDSTDPDYYEKPYNPDGVTPGSYKGIVQVDPYWCAPQLDQNAASRPDAMHFYEPTWWIINERRYHRSHLIIYRHREPPDLLKPNYQYGGIPVPQMIMERVYAAERVANEAPQLAMTKRTTVWQTDMAAFAAKGQEAIKRLLDWVRYRDNYGVKLGDKEGDAFSQYDTALTDLDAVIMTEYQIVAAAANVPSTKLLGTAPKGFNATGEYEEANYHEELESIQAHDLTPLIERHHELVMRAYVIPALGGQPVQTTVSWRTLDTPTARELADTNLVKAQTGAALIASGALDSADERRRIATDPDGGYQSLGLDETPEDDGDGDDDDDDPDPDDDGPRGGNAQDSDWKEGDHPRAPDGKFGKGGSAGAGKQDGEGKSSGVHVELTGNELGAHASTKELRNAAMAHAEKYMIDKDPITNVNSGHDIKMTRQGVKHTLSRANSTELKLLPGLPQLLARSAYVGSEPDRLNRPHIKAAHKYLGTASVGGEHLNVGIVTHEKAGGHEHYDHFIVSQK